MATDIKIASLAAILIDFQESGSSSESDEELFTSATSLAIAVYDCITFLIYTLLFYMLNDMSFTPRNSFILNTAYELYLGVHTRCPVYQNSFTTWYIQSTLVISNSRELTETLRDIRTSTYQS